MVNKYILLWVRCSVVIALMLSGLTANIASAATLGQTVTNIASVSYEQPDGEPVTVLTNAAEFVIEAARTQSTIEFFRYAPNAPEALSVQLNGADYAPNGQIAGPFIAMPAPERTTGVLLKPEAPVSLTSATTYFSGELMFVRVEDLGQNGDPSSIETIVVTIQTAESDEVTLRLYESGEDTGQFWAWVPSSRDQTATNDPVLTTPSGTLITATYVDSFDATEVSVDTALVDPYGRVFNGITGEFVDNARVTLIDVQTGQPADIFGIDGRSSYPSSVMSGQDVTDAGGLVYAMRPGEFRFPLIPRGEYFVRVEPPEGFSFASSGTPADFVNLTNAPFVIETAASYGGNFMLGISGPLSFDIPLDAETDFVLAKTSDIRFGDVGDFIPYTVTIENRGSAGSTVVVIDTLPRGFRYVRGTAKLDAQSIADPNISQNGGQMTFRPGVLRVGETFTLNYVLQIGAGAGTGEAINTIVARDGNGADISNIAHATITLREDLLRSTSTLVGRVAEQACDGDAGWAREIQEGKGVAGVRLYMETGAYAITDEDGLYNFGGLRTGTHVVQIDTETLPTGYEVMTCEENSRYAGSAISQFVEIKGGGLWRANFYLKRNGEALVDDKEILFNDRTEYKNFDAAWLDTQTPDADWVYPSPDRTPSIPSVNIGIKHAPGHKVSLILNGKKVAQENFEARDSNSTRTVMLSRWRGVDILEGDNRFKAVFKDELGKVVKTLTRNIHYVKNIARATALPDQSILVADGRTPPVLAVRLEDEAGRPVHAGRIAQIDIPAPYILYNKSRLEGAEELVSPNSARANIMAGPDGIARIELEPTLQTGKVTIVVTLDNGRKLELFMYLEPEKRDWIIVGLAEGSAAYNRLKNKSVALASGAAEDLVTDGRVAFFAKGLIKGNWLLTLAVDTDKRRGTRDGDFRTEIDPNAYYTLYGDRSYNAYEAASRYPVYIKLEKRSFYAMFGDFSTNITEGKLTRYNRHLSGIKSEYLGETFQALAYGAETNQGFAKDEIAAQGTSGPYFLSNVPVLANSETITIETRDRVRADVILEIRTLTRHLDYVLDNLTGQIIFRLPVDVSDSAFNPNVIVVDYETAQDAERNLSYGGRIQKQILNGKVQIGSTFVHEGGNGNGAGGKSDMVGAEIIAYIAEGTELRAEFATSRSKQNAGEDYRSANAYLAEINHTSKKLTASVYVRSEEAGFGLRQRSSSTIDVRRYGANASYQISEFENEKTGRRGSRNVTASLYREDNLGTGASRTLSEVSVSQESDALSGSFGLRAVQDDLGGGNERQSILAVLRGRYVLPKHGATFQVTREQPLGGKGNVDDFPERTRLSVEKTLTEKASVRVTHDILGGERNSGQNTAIGVTYAPWAGTELKAGSDMVTSDSGRRIGATIGLDQQFQIDEKWSTSFGLANRRMLSGTNNTLSQVAPDAAVSGFENNEAFTAAYVGLGYRTGKASMSGRLEAREAANSNNYIASFAAAREVSETLSFAGAVRANFRDQGNGASAISNVTIPTTGKSNRIDGRIGAAWRPKDNGIVFLNRLDIRHENGLSGTKTTKVVNNFTANKMISDRWQVAGNYGIKYVQSEFDGNKLSGVSHLLGAETRFDVTEKIDIGLHGSVLIDQGTNTTSYAYGPSIGLSPVDNVWFSLGYNVVGYRERDFAEAEYAQKGLYLKFRFKFDQNSAKGLLNMISPLTEN
ncbi:MAG: DUF11 domain-containing protein [Robiginitomaculum sp.]|nr:DUF11 domain-containing protein [Robiginitomaculum sp.]